MTTTTNPLTNVQAIRLCKEIDTLNLIRKSLEELYEQHPDRLDRAYEKHQQSASKPSTQAIQEEANETPQPLFKIVDFLNPHKRKTQFDNMFLDIDGLLYQTESIRVCFDRGTQKLNQAQFDRIPIKKRTFDFDKLIKQIDFLQKFCSDLRKILIRD